MNITEEERNHLENKLSLLVNNLSVSRDLKATQNEAQLKNSASSGPNNKFECQKTLKASTKKEYALFKPSTNPDLPELSDYCRYLVSEAQLESEVLVLSFILYSRFLADKKHRLLPVNYHKLLATIFFVAQKYLLDLEIWSVPDFCLMAGLSERRLRNLEGEYLNLSRFRLFVS